MLALIRAVSQSDRGLAALNLVQHNYCVIMLLPPPSVAAPKLARAFFGAEGVGRNRMRFGRTTIVIASVSEAIQGRRAIAAALDRRVGP